MSVYNTNVCAVTWRPNWCNTVSIHNIIITLPFIELCILIFRHLNAQIAASYHMPWCVAVMACLARLFAVITADKNILSRVSTHITAMINAQRQQQEESSDSDIMNDEDELGGMNGHLICACCLCDVILHVLVCDIS